MCTVWCITIVRLSYIVLKSIHVIGKINKMYILMLKNSTIFINQYFTLGINEGIIPSRNS